MEGVEDEERTAPEEVSGREEDRGNACEAEEEESRTRRTIRSP